MSPHDWPFNWGSTVCIKPIYDRCLLGDIIILVHVLCNCGHITWINYDFDFSYPDV